MKKSILKRTLSIVLACIMIMSIFAAIPMQAGAALFRVSISKCSIYVPNCTFNGKYQCPEPTVKYGTKELKKGVDFTVEYKNNRNIKDNCMPSVTVYGKGKYSGSKTVNFMIRPISINQCTITHNAKLYYNGKNQVPTVTVRYNGTKLKNGLDYSVSTPLGKSKYPGTYPYFIGGGGGDTDNWATFNVTGVILKEFVYTISVEKPGSAEFTKINKNKIKVDWSSVKCDEYEIQGWNGKKWVVIGVTATSQYTAPRYSKYRVRAYVKDPYTRVPTFSSWATYYYN